MFVMVFHVVINYPDGAVFSIDNFYVYISTSHTLCSCFAFISVVLGLFTLCVCGMKKTALQRFMMRCRTIFYASLGRLSA